MSAQKNLRKTWKVSWQSTKKVFYKNQNKTKLFGLGCYILLYTAGLLERVATWQNTIDPAWILKILQKHLPREHIQNEKNESSALFIADLPKLLLG